MRRFAAPILIGLGAFLLIAAALLKFYAYPQVAVAPIDQDSVTYLEAEGATVFDTSTLSEITVDLEVASTTRGDVAASEEAGDDVLVWTGTTTITSDDGVVRSQRTDRAAHDAHTGEAVNCCGGFSETTEGARVPVKRSGLVYKFPFGTEKKDYDFWDSTLGDAANAKYLEEDQVKGVDVYVFEMSIPPTVVGSREVPGSVVGEEAATVEADVVYGNTKTFWVEPNTGAVIDRREETRSTLAVDGVDRVTATEADISYTDAQINDLIDKIDSEATLLGLLNGLVPVLALLLGLVSLAAGLLLIRRSEPAPPLGDRDRTLVSTP
jgi:hypothetical protein